MREWQLGPGTGKQWPDRGPSLPCVVIDLHSVLLDFYDEPEIWHEGTSGFLVAHQRLLVLRVTASPIVTCNASSLQPQPQEASLLPGHSSLWEIRATHKPCSQGSPQPRHTVPPCPCTAVSLPVSGCTLSVTPAPADSPRWSESMLPWLDTRLCTRLGRCLLEPAKRRGV